jgi:hypothetical protein
MPIGAFYQVAVLLTNCMSCFRDNAVSSRFGIETPSIERYLNPDGMYNATIAEDDENESDENDNRSDESGESESDRGDESDESN